MAMTELAIRIDPTLANLLIPKTGKARAIRVSTPPPARDSAPRGDQPSAR